MELQGNFLNSYTIYIYVNRAPCTYKNTLKIIGSIVFQCFAWKTFNPPATSETPFLPPGVMVKMYMKILL